MKVMGQDTWLFVMLIAVIGLMHNAAWHSTAACLFQQSFMCDNTSTHLSDIHGQKQHAQPIMYTPPFCVSVCPYAVAV